MNRRYHLAASRLLNRLLPHHCPICDEIRLSYGLCEACWTGLSLIADPVCDACGRPFAAHHLNLPHNRPDKTHHRLCGACLKQPPACRRQRAILRYDETSKALILPFKHGSRLDYTPLLAQMMQPAFSQIITDRHLILPVPLHLTRRLYRRYNQSAELARQLCQLTKRQEQLDMSICYRRKNTKSLARHNYAQRQKILKQAFALSDHGRARIKGHPILVIDDVMTTGQTLHEIALCLKQGGASDVDSLTLARIL